MDHTSPPLGSLNCQGPYSFPPHLHPRPCQIVCLLETTCCSEYDDESEGQSYKVNKRDELENSPIKDLSLPRWK